MENYKKFSDEITKRFSESVYALKEEKKYSLAFIQRKIGYNSAQALNEVIQLRTMVQEKYLTNYCEAFGFDKNDFLPYVYKGENIVSEPASVYQKKSFHAIVERFENLEKTNEMFFRMMETGMQLTKNNSMNYKELKELIGV